MQCGMNEIKSDIITDWIHKSYLISNLEKVFITNVLIEYELIFDNS